MLIESLSKTLITTIPRPFPRAILYTLIWSVKYYFINLYLRITELNIELFCFSFVITRTPRLVLLPVVIFVVVVVRYGRDVGESKIHVL